MSKIKKVILILAGIVEVGIIIYILVQAYLLRKEMEQAEAKQRESSKEE